MVYLGARNSEISLEKERIILGSGLVIRNKGNIFSIYRGLFKVGKIKIKNEENIRMIKRDDLELAGKSQLGMWKGVRKHDSIGLFHHVRMLGKTLHEYRR